MSHRTADIYFHVASKTPDFTSDRKEVISALQSVVQHPGWHLVPAQSLVESLRAAGEAAVADQLAAMEADHIVLVFWVA